MSFLEEIRVLKKTILFWIAFLLVVSALSFFFGPGEANLFGKNVIVPTLGAPSFATELFFTLESKLVPVGVELIVTNPFAAFIAQVKISFLIAFMLGLPFLIYALARYLAPALYGHERSILFKVTVPSFVLFIIGAVFAYAVVIPPTFRFLYEYASNFGVVPFFSVNEFISIIFGLAIMTGVLFLLPVFMYILSRLGIVEGGFWSRNWRYALVTFLIFSAIITPDGSGVSMVLLTLPMAGLYAVGIGVSRK